MFKQNWTYTSPWNLMHLLSGEGADAFQSKNNPD